MRYCSYRILIALLATLSTLSAQQASSPLDGGISAPIARVTPIVSMRTSTAPARRTQKKSTYSFKVKDIDWFDTGIDVVTGERIDFSAKGEFPLADGRKAEPAGLDRGWRDLLRQFPSNEAPVGALIGRISDSGASVPFAIGSDAQVTAPTSGRLYLRPNLPQDLALDGSFSVKLDFPKGAVDSTSVLSAATSTPEIATLVSPATFAEIPRRVSDQQQHPGDMVNFALVGTRGQVTQAFKAAGWVAVDQSVDEAIVHGIMATLSREAYISMPMSALYLFGRPQDLSYARAEAISVAAVRHHLRVWNTGRTVNDLPLWVGSATYDNGFERDQRNGQVTHSIDPEIDNERKFILDSFDATGAFSSAAYVLPDNPFSSGKTATGGDFHSDGRILIMLLK